MGSEPGTSEGKIRVDEHYPSEADDGPPFDIKKIENIRSNVKFDQCYEISKHIGDGKFGKVFHVKDKSTGLEYAAKFIKIRKEADRADVEREVSILTNLRHPRIAQIYDAFYTTTNEVVLIMEIVRGGELFDRVADENYVLTEQAVAMIICQLCEAISYIHQQKIIHLDVKPENIMCVTQTGNRIKLIDFGLARYYDGTQELKYMAGTPEFAAPEVIKYENLDYHTDMWSVGVITYILLSGYSPFLGDNLGETYCNVEKGVWEFTEEFDAVTPEAKDFISKLLIYDQRKRMLPVECLAHPWISKHRCKAMIDSNLEKPGEGPKIDNSQMRGYNAKRKFRRMVIYVKFLIEMNRLRNSLRDRKSETGQKFFDPLLKLAEQKEKRVAAVASALANRPPAPPKSALGALVELATLDAKKRASVGVTDVEKTLPPTKEKTLPPKKPSEPSKLGEEKQVVKVVTKTVVDPVTGEIKTVKKKSVKKPSPDGEKKASVKRMEKKAGDATETTEPASTEAPKKKKTVGSVEIPAPSSVASTEISSKRKSLLTTEEQSKDSSQESLLKKKSLTSAYEATSKVESKKKSLVTEEATQPVTADTPKKKKSVVLVETPLPPAKQAENKPESLLDVLKKRKSLPADIPIATPIEEKKEVLPKKRSLMSADIPASKTKTQDVKEAAITETPKRKSLETVEMAPVQPKIQEPKEKYSTTIETAKKRKSIVTGAINDMPVTAKSVDNLIVPRVEKKAQKSESSDSTKENREQVDKKPARQGAIKKKEKLDDNVLNIVSTRRSLDSTISQTTVEKDGKQAGEAVVIRKRVSLKTAGEKDHVDETKLEAKKEDKKGDSVIKARLSKLNSEAPPLQVNIMSVAQKSFPAEEKKASTVISMTPEKLTTTTTSTTTTLRKNSSITEKKVHLTTDGKTVEQVETTNSTQDKVKVSQITTKKEESPELEAPVTSVKKRVVKQNTLKAQSEKQRKEEEKTKDGSIVQVSKVLNDKILNQMAVDEHTTLPSGATKKVSLTSTSEVNKKIEGKAEAEVTPKRTSLKKADVTLTEKAKTTLGSDINGNKTVLQKSQKTEVKITPTASKEELIKVAAPKDPAESPKKRSSLLSVPKLISRDNSEERKTVRFAGDVKETAPSCRPTGLQKLNSESCLHKKVQAAVKIEERQTQDDGDLKRKKRILIAAKSEEVYTPKDEFSFDSLKEKLLRRVSTTDADNRKDAPKDCVTVAKTHSVKDRLRQFEIKKL